MLYICLKIHFNKEDQLTTEERRCNDKKITEVIKYK